MCVCVVWCVYILFVYGICIYTCMYVGMPNLICEKYTTLDVF